MTLNRRVSARELRRTLKQALPAINAAGHNELKTRERVDVLESETRRLDGRLDALVLDIEAHLNRGFWGRLRWLLRGV